MTKKIFSVFLMFITFYVSAAALPPITRGSSSIDSHFSMPDNLSKPLKVGVAFIVNSIVNIDEVEGKFEADVDLTMQWNDPNLSYDPEVVGTNLRTLDTDETNAQLKAVWTPIITISNIEKIANDTPSMTITPEGGVTYVQRIKAVFNMHPNLDAFPFDKQKLVFYLDAEKNTTNEVVFVQDQKEINQSGIRQGVKLTGWNLQGVSFSTLLIRGAEGGFYPRYEVTIAMARISGNHLFAFAPLFLIMLSPAIITLYNDSTLGSRLTAWGAALLALIAVSFALKSQYPALKPTSILPQIISIVLIFQFLMVVVSMTVVNAHFSKRFKNPYLIPELLNYLRWALPFGFILIIISRIFLVAAGG